MTPRPLYRTDGAWQAPEAGVACSRTRPALRETPQRACGLLRLAGDADGNSVGVARCRCLPTTRVLTAYVAVLIYP